MATIPRFEINGVLSPNNTVLQNLNDLCTSCGSWVTYDSNTGLWSVVINKPGDSVKSFDDSNIIGSINISGTGINEFYNAVSVEFPHKDLRDVTDYVDLEIPVSERFPNEPDNTLNMSLKYINDPVQAAFIAQCELKQSRVDKVIEFGTDYTALGLRAGQIIDVTSSMYGYVNKKFRVTKLQEADDDNGSIIVKITAIEYDDDIYNDSGLVRTERTKKTGIIPKSMNSAVSKEDANALASGMSLADKEFLNELAVKLSAPLAQAGGLTKQIYATTFPLFYLTVEEEMSGEDIIQPLGSTVTMPFTGKYKCIYNINWGSDIIGYGSYPPPLGVYKNSRIYLALNGQNLTDPSDVSISFTGDAYSPLYEDHYLETFFTANEGDQLSLAYGYQTNAGIYYNNLPDKPGFPDFAWPAGARAFVILAATLQLVG